MNTLDYYIKNRLTTLDFETQDLFVQAERTKGEEYRNTLSLIGDISARKQELLLLQRTLGSGGEKK